MLTNGTADVFLRFWFQDRGRPHVRLYGTIYCSAFFFCVVERPNPEAWT